MIDAEDFEPNENLSLREQLEWFDPGDYFEVAGMVYRVDGSRYVQVDPATLDEIGEGSYLKKELLERIPKNEVLSPYGLDSNGVLTSYAWMEDYEDAQESNTGSQIREDLMHLLQQRNGFKDEDPQNFPKEPPNFSLN